MKKKFYIIASFIILCCMAICVVSFFDNRNAQEVYAYTIQNYNNDYDGRELPSSYYLRDEYMIFAQTQSVQGLCWEYASSMALSTTIMKATGEYIEYSDGWISNAYSYYASSYKPGGGGNEPTVVTLAEKYGLVLEQDYVYDIAFSLTKENTTELFNKYVQYANKNVIDNVEFGRFSFSSSSSNKEQVKKAMKQHILEHGAVTTALTWTSYSKAVINGYDLRYKTPNVSGSGGHAVTIIGWNDDIEIEYNEKTYKGAWLALNSYSNKLIDNGNEGIVYLLYDDTNFWGSYYAYKYNPKITEDIYLYSKIDKSNASYITDKKAAAYGNFVGENAETKQKNMFFEQNNVDLTYSYIISDQAQVDYLKIYSYGKDITDRFNIVIDNEKQTYQITGYGLDIGAYKVVVVYSNSGIQDEIYNCFYILDGTEINFIDYECSDGEFGSVNNNGFYQHFNNFNVIKDEIVYGTSKTQGVLGIDIIFATYHKVNYVNTNMGKSNYESGNHLIAYVAYNTQETENYEIELVSSSGITRKIYLTILNPKDEDSLLTRVIYNLDNADANPNYSKIIISKDAKQKTYLNNPQRHGYYFRGWYYDKALTDVANFDEYGYYVDYNKIIQSETDTVYYSWRYGLSYKKSAIIFLYAKWEAKPAFTLTSSFEGCGTLSYLGENVIYENDDIVIKIIPDSGFIIDKITVDGVELNENEIYAAIANGYTLKNINENHTISVVFKEYEQVGINDKNSTNNITIYISICLIIILASMMPLFIKKKRY